MAKSKKKKSVESHASNMAERALQYMNYKDLKRAVIARGMPFDEVINASVLQLHTWFSENFDRGQDLSLINEFDQYVDEQITAIGKNNPSKKDYIDPNHPLKHASLKLGFIAKMDEEGNVLEKKKPRLKGLNKPKKKKRERVEGTKVMGGTKKGITYQLTMKGMKYDQIVEKVKEAFEDANPASIMIWHKRCLKEMKEKK